MAKSMLKVLRKNGIKAQILSSDMVRRVVAPEPNYSLEERDMVYSLIICIAKVLVENKPTSFLTLQAISDDIETAQDKK